MDVGDNSPRDDGAIIDFEPSWLYEDASFREVIRLFIEGGLWAVPVVSRRNQYLGTVTLRSTMASGLRVPIGGVPRCDPVGSTSDRAPGHEWFDGTLERPVYQFFDLEVPAVRLSTALPQLLLVLCRRSPIVPIVSDSDMRLLGTASLGRAVQALYGPMIGTPRGYTGSTPLVAASKDEGKCQDVESESSPLLRAHASTH